MFSKYNYLQNYSMSEITRCLKFDNLKLQSKTNGNVLANEKTKGGKTNTIDESDDSFFKIIN